jgi:hypothetical protein
VGNITIAVHDDILTALDANADGFAAEMRVAAAMKMFELRRLSSGAAALLAGIPRAVFISKLGEYGIQLFRMTGDDVQQDEQYA